MKTFPAARLACHHLARYAPGVVPPRAGDIVWCLTCRSYQQAGHVFAARFGAKGTAMCTFTGYRTMVLRGPDGPYSREVELVCTLPAHQGDAHYDETFGAEFGPVVGAAA